MEKATEFKDKILESLTGMWPEIFKILINLLIVLVILIIGWLVTKLVVKIIKKALKLAKANKLDNVINDIEIVDGKKLNFDTIKTVSKVVKWIMYTMIIIIISDVMSLTMVSEGIASILGYLPKLFSALAIFLAGLILANIVKKGLKSLFESMDLSGAKFISQTVFFLILTFVSITALNQAGINTEIITSNLIMILAAFLLAFALAFGFGAQKIVGDLLRTFYTRKTYEIGQKIEFNNIKGEVESIDGITVTIKTKEGKLVVPIKDIVESQVRIQG